VGYLFPCSTDTYLRFFISNHRLDRIPPSLRHTCGHGSPPLFVFSLSPRNFVLFFLSAPPFSTCFCRRPNPSFLPFSSLCVILPRCPSTPLLRYPLRLVSVVLVILSLFHPPSLELTPVTLSSPLKNPSPPLSSPQGKAVPSAVFLVGPPPVYIRTLARLARAAGALLGFVLVFVRPSSRVATPCTSSSSGFSPQQIMTIYNAILPTFSRPVSLN